MKKISSVLVISLLLVLILPSVPVVYAQPPREETLYVSSTWGAWNPYLPSFAWAVWVMYNSLYVYSPFSDEWIPILAERYEWIDKYTLAVKIRSEAKWWDGKPITAYDVEYTFKLGKKYVIGQLTPLWDYLEDVVAINNRTVLFITSERKVNIMQMLDCLTRVILPKHRWEALEREYGDRLFSEFIDSDPEKIIGSGPYKLQHWTEDVYTYVRVDDWWGKDIFGLPRPKYIVQLCFKDNPTAALAFEEGRVDVGTHFFPAIYEMWEVKGLARRTYYKKPPYFRGVDVVFLWINFETKGLDNVIVRRAIAHAIPFNDIVSKAYYNYSIRAAPVPIVHTSPAAVYINRSLIEKYGFDYDLDKAKKILDDAGIVDRDGDGIRELPDGTELGPYTIRVIQGWTDWMMMAEMIAESVSRIGIKVEAEFVDGAIWWERLGEKKWDFVLGWADTDIGFAHPWNAFRSTMDPRLSHPLGNWENYKNEEVIPLIDAIPRESDPEKLMAIYSKLQEIWLRDLPGIPLYYGSSWYEFSEEYWVGWPAEENEWWFAGWWWTASLVPLFYLVPKGETPKLPDWVTATKFSTSKIFEALAGAPWHGIITTTTTVTTTKTEAAATVTVTSTTTSVVTTTFTTEVTVPTMDVASVAGASIVALIVGVAAGWVIGSRKKTT